MIRDYKKYMLNKYQSNLMILLEGAVYSTEDFLNRIDYLGTVNGKVGEIATAIYFLIKDNKEIDDKDLKQNFFDITDKEDAITFIQNNKLKDWDKEEDPNLPYTIKGRTEIRIGRIIKYLIDLHNQINNDKLQILDKDIEQFVNSYKASNISEDIVFRLVSGDDIKKYYRYENYSSSTGQLGNSCMASSPSNFFNLYSENPNVQMLIYVDRDDKIHGRALVWNVDKSPCNSKVFMDRIYCVKDSDMIKFKKYADDNNWFYKKHNAYGVDAAVEFIYKGSDVYGEVIVKLEPNQYMNFPFLDTLMFTSQDHDVLSNIPFEDCLWSSSSSGYLPEPCDTCGGEVYIHENDAELTPDDLEILKTKYNLTTGTLSPVENLMELETGDICVGELGNYGLCVFYIYKDGHPYAIQNIANGSEASNKYEWLKHGRYSWILAGRWDYSKVHYYHKGKNKLKLPEYNEKEMELCDNCGIGHIMLKEKGVSTEYNKI
jgi:hypothetical protein